MILARVKKEDVIRGIFILLLVYTLDFARAVLVPVVLALFSYMILHPATRALERIHVPRALGAAVTLIVVLGLIGIASIQLVDPAKEWISHAPERIRTIEGKVQELLTPFERIRKAADDMGNIAIREDLKNRAVSIKNSTPSEFLLGEARAMITNGVIIVVLVYFLLAAGDNLWKAVPHVGSSRRNGHSPEKIARDIESRLSVYLRVLTVINLGVGVLVGLGMFLIGMPNPVLWGALAGVLNFVPYLGALAGEIIVAMVALFSFDSLGRALLAPMLYFVVTFIEGNFITPMILGKQFTISPVVIVLSMMFWGWLWGIIGVFLAVPIIMLASVLHQGMARVPPAETPLRERPQEHALQ